MSRATASPRHRLGRRHALLTEVWSAPSALIVPPLCPLFSPLALLSWAVFLRFGRRRCEPRAASSRRRRLFRRHLAGPPRPSCRVHLGRLRRHICPCLLTTTSAPAVRLVVRACCRCPGVLQAGEGTCARPHGYVCAKVRRRRKARVGGEIGRHTAGCTSSR